MVFEKLAYFAADELFPVVAHDLGRHSEPVYDVVLNEIVYFFVPDLFVCVGFNPLRKIVSHKQYKLSLTGCPWKRANDVHSPLHEWPW